MAYVRVCGVSDLAPGEALRIEVGPEPIGLFNVAGDFLAIDDTCTHGKWSLCDGYLDGDEIECTLHMAKFNLRTGAVVAPPATAPVKVYPVKIEDGAVLIDLTAGRHATGKA